MTTTRYISALLIALCALLVGCGGGGGSSNGSVPLLSAPANMSLSGFLSKSPIDGAVCRVFDADAHQLASTSTLAGEFELTDLPNQPLSIECSGGTYIDEATGLVVDATNLRLRGYLNPTTGTAQSLSVTPLTEIAFQLANADGDLSDYSAQLERVATQFGLTLDPLGNVIPDDPNRQPLDGTTTSSRYALVLATISSMANMQSPASSTTHPVDILVTQLVNELQVEGRLTSQAAAFRTALTALPSTHLGTNNNLGLGAVDALLTRLPGVSGPQGYALQDVQLVPVNGDYDLQFTLTNGEVGAEIQARVYSDGAAVAERLVVDVQVQTELQTIRVPLASLATGGLTLAVSLTTPAGTGPWVSASLVDSDVDGLSDLAELRIHGTDPQNADVDSDGLFDGAELANNTDPFNPDSDGDGLNDGLEVNQYMSNPLGGDSDGDGLLDYAEVIDHGTHPGRADTDGDGLSDPEEVFAQRGFATSPSLDDTDNDGLNDFAEIVTHNTHPLNPDTDGDSYLDGLEINEGQTDPLNVDSDNDSLEDGKEVSLASNPNLADTDADGVQDAAELAAGTKLTDADSDADGLSDGDEATQGTNPLVQDTDADGVADGTEVAAGSNPLVADTDADGLSDFEEIEVHSTNPNLADSDSDGWTDRQEVALGLDPNLDDTALDLDADGVANRAEFDAGTDLTKADTDGDGLNDGAETPLGTDPLVADTDGDGLEDGFEVDLAANPLVVDSDGDGIADGAEPLPRTDTDGDGRASLVDTDSDGDGLPDGAEIDPFGDFDNDKQINMLDDDADNDRISDGNEVAAGLNPRDPADAVLDSDNDGLLHRDEIRLGTDPNVADTDADGLNDQVEHQAGLDPLDDTDATADADNDGLTNSQELDLATNLFESDSDGDGLTDGQENLVVTTFSIVVPTTLNIPANANCGVAASSLELTEHPALTADTDRDGVVDGDELAPGEDYNGDGVPSMFQAIDRLDCLTDAQVVANGFNVVDGGDSDGDGLSDGQEFLTTGTNPFVADTDADGLSDQHETVTGCYAEDVFGILPDPFSADSDGDGIPDGVECGAQLNPLAADTDGDSLLDNDEFRICTQADIDNGTGCALGNYHAFSNPKNSSEDGDAVPDGVDYDTKETDFDQDGLIDDFELTEGWNLSRVKFATTDGVAFVPGTQNLPVTQYMFSYRVVVKVSPQTLGQTAPATLSGIPGSAEPHAVHPHGAQYISGPFIRVNSQTTQSVSLTGTNVRVEQVFLMGADSDGGFYPHQIMTFADEADSDGDGINDGQESGDTAWFEAEHYADVSLVSTDAQAGNGQSVGGTTGDVLFETTVGLTDPIEYPVKTIPFVTTFYIRARAPEGTGASASIRLELDEYDPEGNLTNTRTINLTGITEHYNWQLVGTFDNHDFWLGVLRIVNVNGDIELDQLAYRYGVQNDDTYSVDYLALSPEQQILAPFNSTYELRQSLPFGVTNPMSADTDGDGFRTQDGDRLGSAGWLTDGHELANRMNPFSTDSDADVRFAVEAGASSLDEYTSLVWNGIALVASGSADGRPDYGDAADPSPASYDFDGDGLQDALEIALELARLEAACIAASEPVCDFNDITDLAPYCGETLTGASLPLCAYADDDWDDDGIVDGAEDLDRDGELDLGETDPTLADTDGDCINDGVELGLTCPAARHTLLHEQRLAFNDLAICDASLLSTSAGNVTHPGFFGAVTSNAGVTDPAKADTDSDGLTDGDGSGSAGGPGEAIDCRGAGYDPAYVALSSPLKIDTDSDGLDDYAEYLANTLPGEPDTDADSLTDFAEVVIHLTDPNLRDTDKDGLSDAEELRGERGYVLDPTLADTDADGIDDLDEIEGTGALASCNIREFCGTDTQLSDAELNLLTPAQACPERCAESAGTCLRNTCDFGRTNPTLNDTDGDGLADGLEVTGPVFSNPHVADTDSDGLSDGDEVRATGPLAGLGTTNPTRSDSDGDTLLDITEVEFGSTPTDANSRPMMFQPKPGGLTIDLSDWQLANGVLSKTGRQELKFANQPAFAVLDGTLTLTRSGTEYLLSANGDFIAVSADQESLLWAGDTHFSADFKSALPAPDAVLTMQLPLQGGAYTIDFDRSPACEADPTCTDQAGPDSFHLGTGQIEDTSARMRIPADTLANAMDVPADAPTEEQIVELSNIGYDYGKQALIAEQTKWTGLAAPENFPWEGRTCVRSPEPIALGLETLGNIKIKPNPNLGVGVPPGPGQPAYDWGGIGAPQAPAMSDPAFAPPGSSINWDPALGNFTLDPDTDFTATIGKLSTITGQVEPILEMQLQQGQDNCLIDAVGGRYSCKYSSKRQGPKRDSNGNIVRDSNGRAVKVTKYHYRGRVDISEHGLIPFQTSETLNFDGLTYQGIPVADQIDLCQDGQLSFDGTVVVPIKKIPKTSIIIDGLMVSDVVNFTSPIDGLGDNDGLFTGIFGTVSWGIDQETADLPVEINVPLKLKLADAVAAMIFDDDGDLQYIAFDSEDGMRISETVTLPDLGIGNKVVEALEGERNHARGIIDVNTGRVEGNMTLRVHNMRMDANYIQTQPVDGAGNEDQNAGSITLKASSTLELPDRLFPSGSLGTLTGRINYDASFAFTATATQDMILPGIANARVGSARLTLTQDSVAISGSLGMPGMSDITVGGTIDTAGNYSLRGTGNLRIHGFLISSASVTASNANGLRFSGVLHLPALAGGQIAHIPISGWYRSATDFGFTGNSTFGINVSGFPMSATSVTANAGGVYLNTLLGLQGFNNVHVGGRIYANGAYQLQGGFNQSLGAVNLAYATLYAQKSSSTAGLSVSANAYLQLHGRMGAWANFGLGPNGAFETNVNMGIFGQTVNMRVLNDGRGTSTYIGATNVGLTIPVINRGLTARMVIENVGGLRVRATALGFTFEVDSAGCFRLTAGISPLTGSVRMCF